ncbi:MAG: LLM class flavin-dependent oxidoreductase [Sphingomonadaceae bacterium]|nr:LLM class flavin-dependent oxidoreductase [Sphingomonadaceae bacterium]
MDVYFFCEQSHHPAWDKFDGMLRGDIPNKFGDPDVSSRLLNEYLDMYTLADECGMNVMVNEHHIASSCMNVSITLTLAVLARVTKKARLLGLGSIITNRLDPIRVAEEYSVVDSISGGRLDMGLVKGAGWELYASNSNPSGGMDRFWEAHDLILEAMTRREPFSWEGEHFDYRKVNLWPRPVQQDHPPVWFTGNSPGSARLAAEKGYVNAAFLTGPGAKVPFDAYRETYEATFGKKPADDRLAYLGMVSCSRDKAQTERNIKAMRAYLASVARMRPAHMMPPGYAPPEAFVPMMQAPPKGAGGGPFNMGTATDEELAKAGIMFWGEPERVADQISAFNEMVGGFGHFLLMGQNAHQPYEDVRDSLVLFGEHALPELEKIGGSSASSKESVTA